MSDIDLAHYSWKERVNTPEGTRFLTPHSDPMVYECPVDYIYEDIDRAVAHRNEMAENYDDANDWVLVYVTATVIEVAACIHCERNIVLDPEDGWVDPHAPTDKDENGGWLDDAIWRVTCDQHDSFAAEHEPDR